MKKIIYLTVSFLILFCFPTEANAMRNYNNTPEVYTVSRALSPNKKTVKKQFAALSVLSEKADNTSKKQATEQVCTQTSNVTVLDSKQVKVKYDLWIVKFFKKLFEID